MSWLNVYLGLGSNLGNRQEHILEAVTALDAALGTTHSALSHLIQTPAWGFRGPDFLNAVVLYRIYRASDPQEQALRLLQTCKEIEHRMGRSADAPLFLPDGTRRYDNRIIDIDILFFGKEQINTKELTVPHPLIAQRPFVLIPLREVAKPSLKTAFPAFFV